MFWITVMFLAVLAAGATIAISWIEKDKPRVEPNTEYVPLASLDGHALCPGCQHPKVAPRTRRTTIIEENL